MRHKTILVTGGAGFIGTNLIQELIKNPDFNVFSIDNYFVGSRQNHLEGATYIEGHTKDISTLMRVKPDLVYHLGEYSRVEQSFDDLPIVWESNVIGTHAVLEYCRENGAKIVYAGSSTKFADNGLGRHQSPYAWTKASNTDLVQNYGVWFGLPYAITYFYNVYGPKERSGTYGSVIEIFRERYRQGLPLQVRKPGTQRRNFTHVEDVVAGLLLVGERGEGNDFGLGAEESFSIEEVARMFGLPIEWIPDRPGNRATSSVDTGKARSLGWQPKHRLVEYINDFVTGLQP